MDDRERGIFQKLDGDNLLCPFCGDGWNVHNENVETEDMLIEKWKCESCGAKWEEINKTIWNLKKLR